MDLRDLIKKIDSIENPETGQKKRIDEGAALSIYGDTPEDINAMAQIFRSAGVTPPPAIVGPKPEAPEAEADVKATEEVPGKASTTPAPSYQDTQYMTKDLAGGINKPKKSYPKVAGGDNPMALEDEKEDKKDLTSSIKETLLSAYADFKKKDQNVNLQNQKKKQKKNTSKV